MDKFKATGGHVPNFNVKVERTKNPFYMKHSSVGRVERVVPGTPAGGEYNNQFYVGTGYLPMPKYLAQGIIDATGVSDQLGFHYDAIAADLFAATDIAAILTEKGFSDSLISNTDDINTILVFKNLVDPFTPIDQAALDYSTVASDSFNLNDVTFVEVDFFRTFDDSFNQTDEARRDFEKTLSDDANVLDLVGIPDGSTYQFAKSLNSTTGITADSFARSWIAFKEFQSIANATENAAIATSFPLTSATPLDDFHRRAWTAIRSFTDSVTITHDNIDVFITSIREFEDNFNLTDNEARDIEKVLQELTNPTDELIHSLNKVFEDITTPQDITSQSVGKVLNDVATAIDLVNIPDGSTFNFIKTLASVEEHATITDVLQRQFIAIRDFSDSTLASDFASIFLGYAFQETLIASDDPDFSLDKIINDSVALADFAQVLVDLGIVISDNFLPDDSDYIISMIKGLDDSVVSADTITDLFVNKVFEETITVTDPLSMDNSKSISDQLNVTQFAQRSVGKFFSNTAAIQESAPIFNSSKAFLETLSSTDLLGLNPIKRFSETITVSEVIDILKGFGEVIEDNISAADQALFDIRKTLSDSINAEDLVGIPDGSTYQLLKSLSDSLSVADGLLLSSEPLFNSQGLVQEENLFQLTKALIETVNASESLAFALQRSFEETQVIADTPELNFTTSFEDTFTESDESILETSKTQTDQVTASQKAFFNINPVYFDQFSLNESIIYQMDLAFSESQTFSELVDVLWDQGVILDDTFTPGDISLIDLTKDLTDIVNTQDLIGVPDGLTYTLGQSLTENINSSELLSFALSKFFSHSASTLDTLSANLGKAFHEDLFPTEVLNRALGVNKNEILNPNDAAAFDVEQSFSNTANLNEAAALLFSHSIQDDKAFANSNALVEAGKNPNDSLSPFDLLNKFDISKIVSDIATVEDLVGIPDGSTYQINKSITDITTLSDTFIRSFSQAYKEDQNVSDDTSFAFTKLFTDQSIPNDLKFSFGFAKPFSETSTATDNASFNFGIPSITDSVSNTDIPTIDNSKAFLEVGVPILDATPLFSINSAFNDNINSLESIDSFTFSKPLFDQTSALDLVGVPDGSTFLFAASFSSSFSTAQSQIRNAGKIISDTASGTETGKLIERSYFSSDYVEFDPTNHDTAYDAVSQKTF